MRQRGTDASGVEYGGAVVVCIRHVLAAELVSSTTKRDSLKRPWPRNHDQAGRPVMKSWPRGGASRDTPVQRESMT